MSQELKKVIAYHSIEECLVNEVGAQLYCVPLAKFREQMKFVSSETYRVSSTEYRVASSEPNTQYVITFDDGDVTNYTYAYPVLKEFGLKAYFFILVGRVGTEGYMNWEQIKELRKAGMVIGSHGMSHCFLTELNDRELQCELEDSKKLLEEVLGVTIDSLSIPRGFYNARVLEKATQAGYKTIFASDNRIAIKADWDLAHFEQVLRKGYSMKERAQRFILWMAKKMLGPKMYERVRAGYLGRYH